MKNFDLFTYFVNLITEALQKYNNSEDIAKYLIDNGVEPHFKKELSKIYRIVTEDTCSKPNDEEFCPIEEDTDDCDRCKYHSITKSIQEGQYVFGDDSKFDLTVFSTKEEAENALNKT